MTTEFENPPAASLETLARSTFVAPNPTSVAIAQDRIAEKAFMVEHDIAVGPHVALRPPVSADRLRAARDLADCGAIVKTARLGYDGKGQHRVGGAGELERGMHASDHEHASGRADGANVELDRPIRQ